MDIPQAREYIARLDALAEHRVVPFSHERSMRWRVFGKGEPVVLIHGGHGSWLHWIRNIEALANDHRVLVPDLPGFGDSHDLPPGSGMQEMVDAVIASLDSLLGGRVAIGLAGFSFGAAVSARIAVRRGAIRRLALLGSARTGTPQRPRAALIRWRKADAALQDAALRHNLLAHMLHDETNLDGLAFEAYVRSIRATRYRSRGTTGSVTLAEILTPFAAPALFIWGEHDVTATPELAKQTLVHGKPDRHYRLLPGGGHWIQFERADAVNTELARWFDSAAQT
ncbi:MAG: alpha/beta fold hydrolase [Burkholderiales bacterium]